MKRHLIVGALISGLLPVVAPVVLAAERVPVQSIARVRKLDVDVWINKDEGGVYRPGESMRVYFRTNGDGYVLVFNIDTDGYVHLIYPYGGGDTPSVEGGRSYRIPARSDPYDLVADGPAGVEYVVAVASPYPFQNLPWYLSSERAEAGSQDRGYEDESDESDSGVITGDPYVGIDRIIRRIAPPGREDQVATSETYFYIERRVEYPRYVCADCHYHPYFFDPYLSACSAFEIRIDATWARYAPIRWGAVRPRYIYRVRPEAPTRYRQWKQQWSSLDGRATLRTRFLPPGETRFRKGSGPESRPARPGLWDARRYREGRFWRGRDEIIRLRERRPPGSGDGSAPEARPRNERGRRDEQPRVRDRERQQPPDNGGTKERDRARNRDEGTVKERRPPDRQEDRGKTRGEDRVKDRNDNGGKDRGEGRANERERPSRRDDDAVKQRQDRGSRDEGSRRENSEDRRDRERPSRR